MAAKKPISLHTRHSTKAEIQQRAANEEMLQPATGWKMRLPDRLRGHDVATKAWKKLVEELRSLEAILVTKLDSGLMIDYCMLEEQVAELDEMRRESFIAWKEQNNKLKQTLIVEEKSLALNQMETAADTMIKVDGRVDRKRALLLQMRQSLYLTPRARAGVAPKGKDPEKQKPDPMEDILENPPQVKDGDEGNEQ
jgi:phage terminase small subunit